MRKVFFITIPTVLICLIALELGLRLCGYFYVKGHSPEARVRPAEFRKDEFRILCLGDSFTFGIGADPESSYPKQLEKILRKNISEKISVINGGRLGNTSSLLLKRLAGDMDKYSPSLIVVLIGGSNGWNLEDSSYFLLYGGHMSFFEKLEELLSALSIYKLLKIGLESFRSEKEADQKTVADNMPHREIDRRARELRLMAEGLYREGKNDLAIEKAKEALKIDNADYSIHLLLAQALLARGEHQLTEEELWKAIRLVDEWDANLVSALVTMFRTIDPRDDLDPLKKHLREHLEKKKADFLIKMIEASADLRENEMKSKNVLDYDLEQIVKSAKKRGIELVLQTYPSEGLLSLNSVMKEISRRYNVCLADNEMVFKGKTRSEFFVPDGHCNAKGYGLMAENVYETLIKKELLPAGIAGARGDGR